MSIIKRGQVGDFNGKIGQVVISQWRGLTVGRSTPKASTKEPTLKQLNQRSKFGLVTMFYGNVSEFISIGHESDNTGPTAINLAVRNGLKNAITGVYPTYALDYSKLPIAGLKVKNEIDGGYQTSLVPLAQGELEISWTVENPPLNPISKPTDLATFVFYSPVKEKFVIARGAATRAMLKYTIQLPRPYVGDTMYGWMFFLSEDKTYVSASDHLGTFKPIA